MKRNYLKKRLNLFLIFVVVIGGLILSSIFLLPSRWPEGAIFVPRDASTLKEALEAVKPGGTIVLQADKGAFHGPIVVATDGITIASTGIAPLKGEGEKPAIAIRADRVTVKGIRVRSDAIGISVEGAGCRLDRILVDSTPIGIRITSSSGGEFSSIRVVGSDIAIEASSCVGSSFRDINIISPTDIGILLNDSRKNSIVGARISGGKIGISLEGSDGNEFFACRVEGCTEVGVRFTVSNENGFTDGSLKGVGSGLVVKNAQGNIVEKCRIDDAVIGYSLHQAIQNRITRTRFNDIHGTGVIVDGGRENSISYNRFSRFWDAGIDLQDSERSLILANVLEGGSRGIVIEGTSDTRILRNVVTGIDLAGIIVVDGEGDRLLDNAIIHVPLGIVLDHSIDETALRNRIESAGVIGLALLNGSDNGTVSENLLSRNNIGILLATSGRGNLSENEISGNSMGFQIYRAGPATRIERNAFVANVIGLKEVEALDLDRTSLSRIGVEIDENGERSSPIIVNNIFDRNIEFDVENDGSDPLYVADNWWGGRGDGRTPAKAVISSGVLLPESGWKGEVAIGTGTGIVQRLLGCILRRVLIDGGYRVIDLIGLGGEETVKEALRARDIDIAWLSGQAGSDSIAIPAVDRPIAIVSEGLAGQLADPTISALASYGAGEPLLVVAPRSLPEAGELVKSYGISPARGGVQWTDSLEEAEALLRFGTADLVIVPSLEESLTLSGFVPLRDDLNVVKGEQLFLVFTDELDARYPGLRRLIADLVPSLTSPVLHQLINRVRLFGEPPDEVAGGFFEKGGG